MYISLIVCPTHRLQEYSEEPPPGSPASHETQPLVSPRNTAPHYDNVGDKHLLPGQLRTSENIIIGGGGRPPKQQQQQQQQAATYTQEQSKKPSPRQSPKVSIPKIPSKSGYEDVPDLTGPNYEDVPDPRAMLIPRKVPAADITSSDYYNPADALPSDFDESTRSSQAAAAPLVQDVHSATLPKQRRQENGGEYSDVFDSLAPGEAKEVIGGVAARNKRAMSDSSPNRTRHVNVNATAAAAAAAAGTETSTAAVFVPSSLPAGDLDEVPELMERGEKLRQSQKDKEVVEFDPNKSGKKKFRVSKNKHCEDNVKGVSEYRNVSINGRDAPDGGGGGGATSDGEAAKEMFECSEDGGREYAVVNKADKQRNRSELDGTLCDGSGAPLHYSPEISTFVKSD